MRTNPRSAKRPSLTSRRNFLKKAGMAAAALTAPMFIPASALGRNGMTAPSERIAMGFIGLGGQGSGHLMGGGWTYVPGGYVARKDVQVLAVCDVVRQRREHARQRCNQVYAERFNQTDYDGIKAYEDFREVLARPDIDAVLVAVPYHWASHIARAVMRAGKDVYCEKPMAVTMQEATALLATANRYGRIYQAGTQQRSEYAGRFRIACDLVRNGRIGQLKDVYAYCLPGALFPSDWVTTQSKPVPAGTDWNMWLGPLPWRPYNGLPGQTVPGLFVGDVNWGPHHYDIIQWIVNPDVTAPIEASYEKGQIHYHYSNGVVVHSERYPGEPVGPDGGACFVGTEGRIAVDRGNLVSYPERILKEPLRAQDTRVYHADSHSGNFLECVRTRRPTICNPDVAVYTMRALLTGGIALALKRAVSFDPVKAEFINDPEANRLCSYATRPPWRV
ncbi:MAG TPA: Gfo/Idh/MocA family oxidoreductase [Candidatus Saccharimonadales bacterium]|nr:Gfo/Idh/MocA family oxidoreductase [Candidatus Saccharimonadales bacterium]